ncbi:hypothetical protein SPRG_12574 [Saprolegnia parasitica CBS 223.65]|uniref:RING-type domain-containing protein n=1 Tax=Saprolegnia parasitica (strain CBS 223.65) TaxID=695850 RepID=A0A067BVP6_SAPPC|nr:hypothetical protein SPRG_12574 [Saprolegnia parasitica CBS 223.65]KDO22594.1 hypothetical protein SPRG_12574 [Saprolegnia parasitica CBS 223.65]|eukprot:XP_012206710.1 hypothetical protein SPRG_12574 [Saprolegnia parasitica CBS 223.65]
MLHDDNNSIKVAITSASVCGCYNEFTFSEPFTTYSVHITWGSTKWMLQKRYSEFHRLYKPLRKALAPSLWATSAKHKKTAPIVQTFLATPFPKKHLRIDTDAIRAERRVGLARFTEVLVALRWHLRAQDATTAIFELVNAFLEVPKHRQTHEARCLSPLPRMSRAGTELAVEDDSGDSDDDEGCAICLCEFASEDENDEAATSVTLPCKHAFHEHCVFSWLELHQSCPICRQLVVYQARA